MNDSKTATCGTIRRQNRLNLLLFFFFSFKNHKKIFKLCLPHVLISLCIQWMEKWDNYYRLKTEGVCFVNKLWVWFVCDTVTDFEFPGFKPNQKFTHFTVTKLKLFGKSQIKCEKLNRTWWFSTCSMNTVSIELWFSLDFYDGH